MGVVVALMLTPASARVPLKRRQVVDPGHNLPKISAQAPSAIFSQIVLTKLYDNRGLFVLKRTEPCADRRRLLLAILIVVIIVIPAIMNQIQVLVGLGLPGRHLSPCKCRLRHHQRQRHYEKTRYWPPTIQHNNSHFNKFDAPFLTYFGRQAKLVTNLRKSAQYSVPIANECEKCHVLGAVFAGCSVVDPVGDGGAAPVDRFACVPARSTRTGFEKDIKSKLGYQDCL